MDSYIVRIYRRDGATPAKVADVVEGIGEPRWQGFNTMEQMWAILTVLQPPRINKGRKATRRGKSG